MKTCEHCQQPMLHVPWCDDCDGAGGFWRGGDVWFPCRYCQGTGETDRCTNTECSGIVWYPLSRDDSQMLRMVERVMREEKLGK